MTRPPSRRSPSRKPPRSDGRQTLGRAGEAAVAAYYERAGFTVQARNLRTTHGELDLVVARASLVAGVLLVAVEVKTRSRHSAPERLVDDREVARRSATLAAVARKLMPSARRLRLRVDIAAVRWPVGMAPEIRLFVGSESSPG